MRSAFVIPVALLALAGCSGAEDSAAPATSSASGASDVGAPTPSTTTSASASKTPSAGTTAGPCDLLDRGELEALAEGDVEPGRPVRVAGIPSCQWPTARRTVIQVIAAPSDEWAGNLPEAVDQLVASGTPTTADLTRIKKSAALIESGREVDPDEACALFEQLLEIAGQSPDEGYVLTVFPTRQDAKAVTGQACSLGRFTSVSVLSKDGLQEPLPIEQVGSGLRAAHERSTSSS